MEDFIKELARDNVTEVKVVLASVVVALAVYQVFLMAVVYGKLRLPFLAGRPASFTHRATGDTIVVVTLIIASMCIGYFGFEDGESDEKMRAALHVGAGISLLAVLALKIVVVRWWHSMGKWLPALGLTVFLLFTLTWLTSAGDFLGGW
jgi:hypothetical protein